jgi:hypothetical protein
MPWQAPKNKKIAKLLGEFARMFRINRFRFA